MKVTHGEILFTNNTTYNNLILFIKIWKDWLLSWNDLIYDGISSKRRDTWAISKKCTCLLECFSIAFVKLPLVLFVELLYFLMDSHTLYVVIVANEEIFFKLLETFRSQQLYFCQNLSSNTWCFLFYLLRRKLESQTQIICFV